MTTITARATARLDTLSRQCALVRALFDAFRADYRFASLADGRLSNLGASDWRFPVRPVDRLADVIDVLSELIEEIRPRIERRLGVQDSLGRRMIRAAKEVSDPTEGRRLNSAERSAFGPALVDGTHPFLRWRRMVAWYVEAAEAVACTRRGLPYVLLGETEYFDPALGGYPGCGAVASAFRLAYDLAATDSERALVVHAASRAMTAALKGAVRE